MLLYNLCCLISACNYFSRHCVNLEVLATNYKKKSNSCTSSEGIKMKQDQLSNNFSQTLRKHFMLTLHSFDHPYKLLVNQTLFYKKGKGLVNCVCK